MMGAFCRSVLGLVLVVLVVGEVAFAVNEDKFLHPRKALPEKGLGRGIHKKRV